jgi:hypothetical protein
MFAQSVEYSLAELVDFPVLEAVLRARSIEPRSFDLLLERPESRRCPPQPRLDTPFVP